MLSGCSPSSSEQSVNEVDLSSQASDKPTIQDETNSLNESRTTREAGKLDEVIPSSLVKSFRPSLSHGKKPAQNQKYIVLHDTEGGGTPLSVVDWWESNGNYVAAHFVIGKDGTIVQCVPLDEIAHHAGFGDTGHNKSFGIEEDGRDDKIGTKSIGNWASDYAMNAWSVGIEMVHQTGEKDYPDAQLEALDQLIAYIDNYYGFESEITDHKAWRSGNSDTSKEFARYLANYKDHRTHD